MTENESDFASVLDIRGLTVRFDGNAVLRDLNVSLRQRERMGLIGPNGAGKSTCVNAITGHVRSEGSIWLDGLSLGRCSPHERARLGIIRTFQNLELFRSMTVEENVEFGIGSNLRRLPVSRSEKRAAIGDTLSLLDLQGLSSRRVSELPYGTRKLVELGRALIAAPKVLLLDEPMAGLDTGEKQHFVEVLRRVFASSTSAILLIEHNMYAIEQLTDRVHVLDAGQSIADGTFEEVIRQQDVIDAYLGL